MNRRKFLASLSVLLGCSIASLDTLAINSALAFTGDTKSRLTKHQASAISSIADIIIPETETPSASQAGVTSYIDFYLHEFLNLEQRTKLLAGIETLYQSNSAFIALPKVEQTAVIQALDDNLYTPQENPAYKKLKQLIVIGYYSSEVGATQALKYDPVPGPYKEMKLKDVGRVWY
ncbi:gluconate 2-dehydrogenase subunit 3 family protein [Colwellia sp. E2M01]|uniref:gluconate 2-dehydrogenase subunit 3 family protein n=1 Tax=Colwellia sp. E2M01 TaxID=2841561 RepID=UPI001C0A243E|nr:gluconate 2-dehydrogenase subunit 3 family protein [Colwellia sp. E2M01]MBU2872053.1 gluconate 2-dehydrogenase subunit 3 family protein [Colwellia sp. E2M01]